MIGSGVTALALARGLIRDRSCLLAGGTAWDDMGERNFTPDCQTIHARSSLRLETGTLDDAQATSELERSDFDLPHRGASEVKIANNYHYKRPTLSATL